MKRILALLLTLAAFTAQAQFQIWTKSGGVATSISPSAFPILAPDGTLGAPSYSFSGATGAGMWRSGTVLGFSTGGAAFLWSDLNNGNNAAGLVLGLAASAGGGADVYLTRDAADTLAQRRTTNPQTFRIYGTFTDASNYERLTIATAAGATTILQENAGTGAARDLRIGASGANSNVFLRANGSDRWQITSNGTLASQAPANDQAVLTATGASVTGSGTTSFHQFGGTWNTSGVVAGAMLLNITNTASGAGSRLLELQRGGAIQFGVTSGAASTGTQIRTAQATVPTCTTNCGTPGNVCVGTDTFMTCTMGTTPASGFVVNFNGTWAAAPSCVVQMALAGMAAGKQALTAVTTTTNITIVTNAVAPVAGDKYHIHCGGIS